MGKKKGVWIKKAVLAIFYCGCNQSNPFHIEGQNYGKSHIYKISPYFLFIA